ncbi:hypothetical protein [Pinibacter soli]|uniref:DUF4136 domain-containing protein n=1 Tax=Pinibacter soli TaxID=3044211 RepID=A0ABT6R9L6_9BACT|nr:hypothetical protein [Pinibacter soli]MDI3319257.1 hypothetical protein [Pinibacter soli]
MKKIAFAFALIIVHSLYGKAQTVDNKNYYSFQQKVGSTNWLRICDAVPTIIDELLKNNIAYHTISVGELMKINDSTRLVMTVSFEKGDKRFGFLYEPSHGIPLNVKDRDFLTDSKKASYSQVERDTKGRVHYMRIDPLPQNVLLLKETCYWFQFGSSETNYAVSKETAQNILRQDIRDYLTKIK